MKHIAFDLDGVLVDALSIHRQCFVEAWNVCVPDAPISNDFHDKHLSSRNTTQKIHLLIAMNQAIGYDVEDVLKSVASMKQRLTSKRIDAAKATVPWLFTLVKSLRGQGRLIALVSNSIRATCERTLSNIGILHLFDTIVASDDLDVTVNKPDPAPYQTAAARLSVPITSFVAVEDSPTGLRAAKEAGCWVYVVARPSRDLDMATFLSWLKVVDAV